MIFDKSQNSKILTKMRAWIGKTFSKLGLSPNQWTIVSFIAAIFAAVSIYSMNFLLGAVFIIISGLIDLIDGAVARHTKTVTRKGAYLDTIVDRYNEFLYVFPLVFLPISMPLVPIYGWVFLYIFGGMMTTYAKAAAKEKGLEKEIRGGMLERAERVGIYTLGLIIASFNMAAFGYVMILLALLSNISAVQRISKAFKLMNN